MLGASLAVRIFKEPVSELEELLLRDKLQLIIVGTSTVGQKIEKSPGKKTREIKYVNQFFFVKLHFWQF